MKDILQRILLEEHEIIQSRLEAQHLTDSPAIGPGEVVAGMAAMQSQDYSGSLWAVGMRSREGTVVNDILETIESAEVVRTWLNRGTIHFSHSSDTRWLMELFSPGLLKTGQIRDRNLGLTEKVVDQVEEAMVQALREKGILTRTEMYEVMNGTGLVKTKGNLGYHLLYRAAWDGLICFGPQIGNEQAFALAEKWLPESKSLGEDQAISKLALKYISGHGPATVRDFSWWSGLKLSQCRWGLENNSDSIEKVTVGTDEYYMMREGGKGRTTHKAHFLPAFDEYLVGYSDRQLVLNGFPKESVVMKNGTFKPVIILDGKVAGIWKSRESRDKLHIQANMFTKPGPDELQLMKEAVMRIGVFRGKEALFMV